VHRLCRPSRNPVTHTDLRKLEKYLRRNGLEVETCMLETSTSLHHRHVELGPSSRTCSSARTLNHADFLWLVVLGY
jgi:hypothetical protein